MHPNPRHAIFIGFCSQHLSVRTYLLRRTLSTHMRKRGCVSRNASHTLARLMSHESHINYSELESPAPIPSNASHTHPFKSSLTTHLIISSSLSARASDPFSSSHTRYIFFCLSKKDSTAAWRLTRIQTGQTFVCLQTHIHCHELRMAASASALFPHHPRPSRAQTDRIHEMLLSLHQTSWVESVGLL